MPVVPAASKRRSQNERNSALRARAPGGRRTRAARRVSLPAACLAAFFFLLSAGKAWALSEEDHTFLGYLIQELKYYDTALRYLDTLEKDSRLDKASQAEVASRRIDILQAQNRTADADRAIQDFQKRFPDHPRATIGDLERIGQKAQAVLKTLEKSRQGDKAKADALRTEAIALFESDVAKPLEGLIQSLQAKVDAARKAAPRPSRGAAPTPRQEDSDAMTTLLKPLEYTELQRLKFYLSYARSLPESAPERKKALEKGLSLSQEFIDKRFTFPLMQFEAQLHIGLFAYELGQHDLAEESLSVLYNITPPFAGPYTDDVIDTFRNLRLQAILFGARARNGSRAFAKAAKVIEQHFLKSAPGPFGLSKAEEDKDSRTNAVHVRLEYGIALAGAGQADKGVAEIHKMIRKPNQPSELVVDARQALGRIAMQGGSGLKGRDFYEAAIGLKSAYQLEAALDCLQRGLASLDPRDAKESLEVAPLCLNEIGEINWLLGRYVESALAYGEVCRYFPGTQKELLAKVARNFVASTNRAMKPTEGGNTHKGLLALKEEATRAGEAHAGGFTIFESIIYDARVLESEGKLDAARKKYLEVKPEVKGVKVPMYWRAQAYYWNCLYRKWDQADAEGKKALDREVDKAVAQLPRVAAQAEKEKDILAAAVASLALGQILYQRGDFPAAVTALKGFAGELAAEEIYRCAGLASLVLAEVKAEDLEAATGHFKTVQERCGESPVAAITAGAIADAFELLGKPADAARYTLAYARHASSRDDMEKPQEIGRVAGVLIDGGMLKEAGPYLEKLREASKSNADLERQVLVLEAKLHRREKQWDKVIAKLKSYVDKFKPQDDKSYDDAFVLKDLGDAYLARAPKPSLKDLKAAEEAHNTACYVMRRRGIRDPAARKVSWQWALEFMKLQMRIGDAGQVSAYRTITNFVESQKEDDMGGFKADFLKLAEQAAAKLEKADGKGES